MANQESPVSSYERRQWIARQLTSNLFLSVHALSDQFGVSAMTIRRDLHALEEAGKATRVWGGVTGEAASHIAASAPGISAEDVGNWLLSPALRCRFQKLADERLSNGSELLHRAVQLLLAATAMEDD